MQIAVVLAFAAVAFAQIVPNEYVNTFKESVSAEEINAHMELVTASGSNVLFNYNFGRFRGYSVRVPEGASNAALSFLKAAELANVEPNQIFSINKPAHVKAPKMPKVNRTQGAKACVVQEEATWGLVRTAKEELNIDGLYPYEATQDGQGVTVYIIDTGIYLENVDFERRAVWGYDAVQNPSPETDQNGHGTHCAGTVGGKDFGIAKQVSLVAVRVLNAGGSGTTAGVIAGVQWAAREGAGKKTISSMSLGGGYSQTLNDAVAAGTELGQTFVIAAGNSNADTCNFSPASEPSAVTVMCSDSSDAFCYFSNWGNCAHIIAPGMGITSAWIGSPFAQNTISGTSMSTPHVAGVAAKHMSANAGLLTPAEVKALLVATGSRGYITGIPQPATTPNVLLHSPCA
jgi:subtilisin family serine protease